MKKNNKLLVITPYIWLVFGILLSIWYQFFRGQKMLDADMSSEMLVSSILNHEHSVTGVTKSWYYSTEFRIISTQWLYRIGLALSPHNWHIARCISMALAITVLAIAAWLVFYVSDMKEAGVWAAAFTVFPGGSWYFWQTIYGGHYLPYIYIMLFSLALTIVSVRKLKTFRGKICFAAVSALALCSGMNGVRMLMVYYVPLVISSVFLMLFWIRKKGVTYPEQTVFSEALHSEQMSFFLIAVFETVLSVLGYMINSKILARIYIFQAFGGSQISSEGSFWEEVKYYIWSFGFADKKVLMSFRGIASMCGLVLGFLTVIAGIWTISRLSFFTFEQQVLCTISVSSILFCIVIFDYTNLGEQQYFQTAVPLGYILLVLMIHLVKLTFGKIRILIYSAVMLLLLTTSTGTILNETDKPFHPVRTEMNLNDVVTWLRQEGYDKGVSQFWTSNIVTELADGEIEMWTIDDYDSGMMANWLQEVRHVDSFPSGDYFYLISNKARDEKYEEHWDWFRAADEKFLDAHPELSVVYQDEDYTVYGTK